MKLSKKNKQAEEEKKQKLIESVKADFLKRQEERKTFEVQWQLNMNFYMGNQYCDINGNFEVENYEKKYFWQEREVYNHITPIIERRLSKLSRVRPKMNVFPKSNDQKDLQSASITKKIIDSVYCSNEMQEVICDVTRWSEICGSGFYKVIWKQSKGDVIANFDNGEQLKTGNVEVVSVSPFEIFPESSTQGLLENQRSLIHAKAFHIEEIKNRFGVDVEGENINIFTLDKNTKTLGSATKVAKTVRENYAIVIEKYVLPTKEYPHGRLIIVCGNHLIYDGELPYKNGVDGGYGYPYIKQDSIPQVGCFWGASVIERLIPLQKSYNAIKNRKHEFINRLSMGILTCEDGSVDMENLEDDGLCPGKVLIYRQGSNPPKYMQNESLPYNFIAEEKALLDEFATISGVSDVTTENYVTKGLSGTALEIMIEQDENKILMSSDNIKHAIKQVGKHILRLYKDFATLPRLSKVVGDNGNLEIFYFQSGDITSDDIVFETKNESSDSFSQRRQMIFDLIDKGILNDEDGKMSARMKMKVLELLGYGIWETSGDLKTLHSQKASQENFKVLSSDFSSVCEIDDHQIHINSHIAFMLSEEFSSACAKNSGLEEKMLKHIREHKKLLNIKGD